MRDPARIPRVLEKLEMYWRAHPDLRLTQLVLNLAREAAPHAQEFYVEDDRIEATLDQKTGNR